MDISTTHELGYRGCIFRSEEDDPGNLFATSFIWKDRIPLVHSRRSKWYASQESRIVTPESSNVREIKVPKLSARNHGADSGRFGGGSALQLQPPPGDQGGNAWRSENRDDENYVTLKGLVGYFKGTDRRLILQAKNIGAWLNVRGATVIGTVFSATEFRDFLCARYNVTPLNLQIHCNWCGTSFKVRHALICSKGGLVIEVRNEVHGRLLSLTWRSITSASVRAEPLIQQGRTRSEREIHQGSDKDTETQGDVMIRGSWYQ